MGRNKAAQKTTRQVVRDRDRGIPMNMHARSSVSPKPMFKARMTARMFGMAIVIPKTMMISRTMRRGKEGIRGYRSFFLYTELAPKKMHLDVILLLLSDSYLPSETVRSRKC